MSTHRHQRQGGPTETALPALRCESRIRRDTDQGLAEVLAAKHLGESGGDALESLADILTVTDSPDASQGAISPRNTSCQSATYSPTDRFRTRTPLLLRGGVPAL